MASKVAWGVLATRHDFLTFEARIFDYRPTDCGSILESFLFWHTDLAHDVYYFEKLDDSKNGTAGVRSMLVAIAIRNPTQTRAKVRVLLVARRT